MIRKSILMVSAISFLAGCASYDASSLDSLSSRAAVRSSTSKGSVVVVAKAFTKADCKKYLDRDVLSKGYQPIQLYIQNNSDKSYSFSLNRLNLSCARVEEVAEKVHTSTVGRVVGYGAAAWLTFGIFVIPAVVDGIKSAQANDLLDEDFAAKVATDHVIDPYCSFNKIIFVNKQELSSRIKVTLVDLESNAPEVFQAPICSG